MTRYPRQKGTRTAKRDKLPLAPKHESLSLPGSKHERSRSNRSNNRQTKNRNYTNSSSNKKSSRNRRHRNDV